MADENESTGRRVRRATTKSRIRLVNHPSAEASETGLGKTILETDSEEEARRWIEQNAPRGREVVLQTPDGRLGHFSADLKAQGHENDGWQDYSEDEVN